MRCMETSRVRSKYRFLASVPAGQVHTTWSPPGENNTSQMITDITNGSGLNPSDHWGTLNSDQQNAFINAYGKREGWKPITH